MLMHITSVSVPHPHSLCELGIPTETNPIVSLSQLTYRKCNKIYGEKEPADYVYQIKSGAVRSFKLLRDSRRQIGAFYVSGDIFGLENGSLHRYGRSRRGHDGSPHSATESRCNFRQ